MSASVEVSNLGPLRSAEVELADLTLIIGDNNTGKTFFATILHRVLNAASAPDPFARLFGPRMPEEVREWFEIWSAALNDDHLSSDHACSEPSSAVLEWATEITSARLKSYARNVRSGIEYAYGVEASELRRRTPSRRSSDCYVRVHNTGPDWNVEVRFDSTDISVNPPDPTGWVRRLLDEETARRRLEPDETARGEMRRGSPIRDLISRFSVGLFQGWPSFAVHLPANRTGIMHSYQVLAGAVVRQSAAAGIRPIAIDPLPGTSADFLSLLLSDHDDLLPHEREDPRLRSLVGDFEKSLGAEITLQERVNSAAAVMAVTPEGSFPLSRASSMISELAPVLLALKGAICWADHLTIDEPEAHLHPAMQRRFASFLTDVVSRGTGVVLTTHSDFFLGEINNLIRSGKLSDQSAPRRRDEQSSPGNPSVSALHFFREQRWCVGRPLAIDPVDGIDESTFTDVMESLYDDSVRLINELL